MYRLVQLGNNNYLILKFSLFLWWEHPWVGFMDEDMNWHNTGWKTEKGQTTVKKAVEKALKVERFLHQKQKPNPHKNIAWLWGIKSLKALQYPS